MRVEGNCVVGNLPKGYLAVLGCDILNEGEGNIDLNKGELRVFGRVVWLSQLWKGESVPSPERGTGRLDHEMVPPPPPSSQRLDRSSRNQPERCQFVYCSENLCVPARSEKLVQVKLGNNCPNSDTMEGFEIVIEPLGLTVQGIYLARSVTRVINNHCWVKAVNVSSEEVLLARNTKLGVLENLEEL